MESNPTPLRDRPFRSAMFARRLRKAALHKHKGKQLTVNEYDQFIAKTRDTKTLQSIFDMADTMDVEWKSWWRWFMDNWSSLNKFVTELPPVTLNRPNAAYNQAPKSRSRRHKLLRYQDDPGFAADKLKHMEELKPAKLFDEKRIFKSDK